MAAKEPTVELWLCSHTGLSGRVYREVFFTKAEADAYVQVTPTASNPTMECYVPTSTAELAWDEGWAAHRRYTQKAPGVENNPYRLPKGPTK